MGVVIQRELAPLCGAAQAGRARFERADLLVDLVPNLAEHVDVGFVEGRLHRAMKGVAIRRHARRVQDDRRPAIASAGGRERRHQLSRAVQLWEFGAGNECPGSAHFWRTGM